jgi:hypothetical protein
MNWINMVCRVGPNYKKCFCWYHWEDMELSIYDDGDVSPFPEGLEK